MGVAAIAVVAKAISKQPVHLGGISSGAPLHVAQILLPTEGELVAVRMVWVCCEWMAFKKLTYCCT